MDTLHTPWPPATTSGGASETGRMLRAHFRADATNQAVDGIHPIAIGYAATWHLRASDAQALLDFLRAHAGRVFLWTMPRETAPRIWLVSKYSRSVMDDTDHHQVDVTMEEQFRP